jgi:hypothetical protein
LAHVGVQIAPQHVDQVRRTGPPEGPERVVPGAAQHHEIGAQCDGAHHVQPTLDAAVEDHRQARGGADRGQRLDAGGGGVELPPGMVADP